MISVILPVYNCQNYVGEAIESILAQSISDFELIIINDGSTDKSEEIIQSYKDTRIRYYKQENKGVAKAKNAGIELAKGDCITIHDADDVSLPCRFERMLKGLESHDFGFVHCDMLLTTETGEPFSYWSSNNIFPDSMYSFYLNVGTPFNNPTILYKKEALNKIRFDESVSIGEDTNLILKIAREWKSYHIAEPLYLYRRHQTNVTNTKDPDIMTKHVKNHLTEGDLRWIIEVDWQSPEKNPLFQAKLIAGVALSRRWLLNEAIIMFNEAIPLIRSEEERDFFEGMKALVENDYPRAENMLSKIPVKTHIIENFLGEAMLLQKKYNEAYSHFKKALSLQPNYTEPIQNIKAIGLLRGPHSIDMRVNKYK